jgi:hypothetical protein
MAGIITYLCVPMRPPLSSSGQSSWLQIRRSRVRFPGTKSNGSGTGSTQPREHNWPPLWSSGQRSWLPDPEVRVHSRHYQIFWDVVGLERRPLSLVSTTEELLGRNSSGSGLESREYCHRDSSRWPRGTLYPQKVGADKRRSLDRYCSLADWGHGV